MDKEREKDVLSTSEEATIWRYMDFTKYVSLLDTRALYFCRADMLGDSFEGSYSKANLRLRPILYKDKIPEDALRTASIFYKQARRYTVLNCWNISNFDSAALWSHYLRSGDGVAIQSTFSRLTRCFNPQAENEVHIGRVKYIDYETEWLPEGNVLYPFIHKRKSFENEQELRAVIQKFPSSAKFNERGEGELNLTQDVFEKGVYVDIDLSVLIERVYVSPTSPDWFLDLIKSISKRYNMDEEIINSGLANKNPVY